MEANRRKIRALTFGLAVAIGGAIAVSADQAFHVESDLVVLQVAASDKNGQPVAKLAEHDFQITEDHVPQQIKFFLSEDQPAAVGLVLDSSTSMSPKRDEVIAAAEAFGRSSNRQDALFTASFNERVTFGLPPGTPFTSDLDVLHAALAGITTRGQTAMYDAISAALDRVSESDLERRALVVVSDGKDNRSEHTYAQVLDQALRSNAVVYTVGIFDEVEGGDRKALRQLAEATGGISFFPEQLSEIAGVFDRISVDIRHRYTLGYVSTNLKRNGRFRAVAVKATDPQTRKALTVRVRSGYVGPSDSPTFDAPAK